MADEKEQPRTEINEGKIVRLSASSIAKYDVQQPGGCPRWFWYRYVARRLEPGVGEAARLGAKIHSEIEAWLLRGESLTEQSKLAERVVQKESLGRFNVEHPVDGMLFAEDIPLTGRVDLVLWDSHEILDWKTTKSRKPKIEDWRELLETVQMVAYSRWYLAAEPKAEQVKLTHAYLRTKDPKWVKVVSGVFSADKVLSRWDKITSLVKEMKQVVVATEASQVSANTASCHYYDGCPHMFVCPLAGREERRHVLATNGEDYHETRTRNGLNILPPDAPESDPSLASEEAPDRPVTDETTIRVFVDVVGPDLTSLDSWVRDCCTAISGDLVDPRLATGGHPLAFGRWRAVLEAYMLLHPPQPGWYTITSEDERNQVALQAFAGLKQVVVYRATR